MTSVGIRELRQRASELLRRVEAGETIEITDRGRPVAVISPLPEGGPIEQLLATGDLILASRDMGDLPRPLDLQTSDEL
jgi:prevent-host-death family protein